MSDKNHQTSDSEMLPSLLKGLLGQVDEIAEKTGQSRDEVIKRCLSEFQNISEEDQPSVSQQSIEETPNEAKTDNGNKKKWQKKTIIAIAISLAAVIAISVGAACAFKISSEKKKDQYDKAVSLMEAKKYVEAVEIFDKISGYEDSSNLLAKCKYNVAKDLVTEQKYAEAASFLDGVSYEDSKELYEACNNAASGNYKKLINHLQLETFTVPTNVTSIGNAAFEGCKSLLTVYFHDDITSIGDDAFKNCTGITGLTLPAKLTSIGVEAFYNCDNLVKIAIPSKVTTIGKGAFEGCIRMTSITIPFIGENKDGTGAIFFGHVFGATAFRDQSTYIPAGLKTVVITGGNTVYSSAFQDCTSIVNITLCDNTSSIGYSAFKGCSNIKSIVIPRAVRSIGNGAFADCVGLSSVTFKADGWRCSGGPSDKNAISINGRELGDESKAATYLKSTYSRYYWQR